MDSRFGDACWDIYENHKGDWCLYKSQLCLEGICSGCQIYQDAKEQWDYLATHVLKDIPPFMLGGRNVNFIS
jgi:hypothetical protein